MEGSKGREVRYNRRTAIFYHALLNHVRIFLSASNAGDSDYANRCNSIGRIHSVGTESEKPAIKYSPFSKEQNVLVIKPGAIYVLWFSISGIIYFEPVPAIYKRTQPARCWNYSTIETSDAGSFLTACRQNFRQDSTTDNCISECGYCADWAFTSARWNRRHVYVINHTWSYLNWFKFRLFFTTK